MKEIRICPVCDKSFEAKKSLKKEYCSNECIQVINPQFADAIKRSVEARKARVGKPNGKLCAYCNKELTGNQSKFCSFKCNNYTNRKIEHIKKARQASKDKQNRLKKFLVDLSGGCCNICGYNKCLKALVFHHIDPTNKSFTLDTTSLRGNNKEKILLELQKCVCLCHNCHSEVHDGITKINNNILITIPENVDQNLFFR